MPDQYSTTYQPRNPLIEHADKVVVVRVSGVGAGLLLKKPETRKFLKNNAKRIGTAGLLVGGAYLLYKY